MGTFSVKLRVGNLFSDASAQVEALVDAGATNSMMPGSLLRRLGIEPVERRTARVADGRRIELEMAQAQFAAEGRNAVARVTFGPEGEFLLGATTLENLGVAVDPVDRRLIPQDDFLMAAAAQRDTGDTDARRSGAGRGRGRRRSPLRCSRVIPSGRCGWRL